MSRNRILLSGGLAVVIVLAAGAWWLGYFDEPDAEANVEDLAAAVQEQAEAEGTETEAPLESLDGVWNVTPVEGQTFIGYRINEVLNTIGDFTVVARTAGVTGSMEGAGTTITAVSIVGDMTTITTDRSGRDNAMKSQALETDQFPEATFVLAEPIELGSIPDEGIPVSAIAVGDLTIHGVTQRVEFPLDAQVQSGAVVVAGQLEVALADYSIKAPSARIVASVEDVAILELSLVFTR
jgi:polyisoprenoid-binding protein YceI